MFLLELLRDLIWAFAAVCDAGPGLQLLYSRAKQVSCLYFKNSRILVLHWACEGEQVLSSNRDVEELLQEKQDNAKVGEEFSEKNHNNAGGHQHQDVLTLVPLVENIPGLFEYAG